MSLLPDHARAEVAFAKVHDYLLNENHEQNGGKAGFFRAFGFSDTDWTTLRDALAAHPASNEVISTSVSTHGVKHVVRCSMRTPDNRKPCVTTVWIIEGDRPPRLVTAYP